MEKLLKNKTILISGVGKGLGLEMLNNCIEHGAFVYGFTRSRKDIVKIKRISLILKQKFLANIGNTAAIYILNTQD